MLDGFIIFLGGGLGGLARWWASGVAAERFGQTFPWGTLLVNVSGWRGDALALAIDSTGGN